MPPGQAVLAKVVESLGNVGKFQLTEVFHSEFCTVYRASDETTHKRIALKLMSVEAFGQERAQAIEVFRQERTLAKKLDHPNIARLLAAGEIGGYLLWVMEWIEGATLGTVIGRGKPFKAWDLIDMARQIAAALDYAGKADIVHHRLHPDNILIESDGTAKIMDFGVPAYPDLGPTASAHTAMAAQYMAAEDLKCQSSQRSNLFGMGAILYHLACGRAPFEPASIQARLADAAATKIPDLRSVNAKVHPGIAAPIAKLLSAEAAVRYASAGEAVRDLENYASFGNPSEEPKRPAPAKTAPKFVATPIKMAPPKPPAIPAPVPAPTVVAPRSQPIKPNSTAPTSVRPETVYTPAAPPRTPVAQGGNAWLSRIQPSALSRRSLIVAGAALLLVIVVIAGIAMMRHNHSTAAPAANAGSTLPPDTPLPSELQSMVRQQAAADEAVRTGEDTLEPAGSQRRMRGRANRAPVMAGPASTVGTLVISSIPDGARVQIDGYNMCAATPCTVTAIPPGTHTVAISKEGFGTESQTVQIAAGNRLPVSTRLLPAGGTVSVSANPPGGMIFVDGRNTNRVTPAHVQVPRGPHTITVRTVGYVDATTTLSVNDGENLSFTPNLRVTLGSDDIKQVGGVKRLFGGNAPKDMGRIQVKTSPRGATVFVNGTAIGKSTPAEFALRAGEYDLLIQMPGYKQARKTIAVENGKKIVVEESLQKE